MQFDVKFLTVVNVQLRMTTKSLKSFFQARAKLRSTTYFDPSCKLISMNSST